MGGDVGKDSSTGPQNLGTVHENPVKVPRALAGFSAVCVSQGGTQKRRLQRLRSGQNCFMPDICDTFDQLRSDIATAQRQLAYIDESVSNAINDEAFAGEPFDPSLSAQQAAAEDHLITLLQEFALLEMLLDGELP